MARGLTDPDRPLVDMMARDLERGDLSSAASMFAEAGAPSPILVWSPRARDVQHPVLANLFRVIDAARRPDGAIGLSVLSGEAYAALSEWCMVLDFEDRGGDFRYAHYGAEIVENYGHDLTGQRTSEIGGHIAVFFMALYRAAIARREVVKSLHEPPSDVFVRTWRRLIVPLADDEGAIRRLLVGNVADNDLRAGFEALPDAVVLVDAAGMVQFANRAATRLFSAPNEVPGTVSFRDFTGLAIALPDRPEEVVRGGARWVERVSILRGTDVVPIQVGIGATYYRDRIFYVITARPRSD